VTCTNVLHPSCAARTKIYKVLKGHRIYCSAECENIGKNNNYDVLLTEIENKNLQLTELEKSDLEKEGKIKKLELELLRAQKVIEDKDKNLSRERKKTQDFADEERWKTKLNEKRDTITLLNKEILEITRNNNLLKANLQEAQDSLYSLQTKIDGLTSLNQDMISTIRTLETDNETYSSELQLLRQKTELSSSMNELSKPLVQPSSTEFAATKLAPGKNSQILIVGDLNVRGLSHMIKSYIGQPIDINCQWSENLDFEQGVELCLALSKNFTHKDQIVLLWGSKNALRGHKIKKDSLLAVLDLCKKTNLILVGPPLHSGRPVLNNIIQDCNFNIANIIKENDSKAYFLPLLATTNNGFLNYQDKLVLASHLCFLVGHLQKQPTNIRPSSNNIDPLKSIVQNADLQPNATPNNSNFVQSTISPGQQIA